MKSTRRAKDAVNIYFVSRASETSSKLIELLKQRSCKVLCFDEINAAFESVLSSNDANLIILKHHPTELNGQYLLSKLKHLDNIKGIQIPVLMLFDSPVEATLISSVWELASLRTLQIPVKTKTFLQTVEACLDNKIHTLPLGVAIFNNADYSIKELTILLGKKGLQVNQFKDLDTFKTSLFKTCFVTSILCDDSELNSYKKLIESSIQADWNPLILVSAADPQVLNSWNDINNIYNILPITTDPQTIVRNVLAIFRQKQVLQQSMETELQCQHLSYQAELYRHLVENQGNLICKWLPDTTLTFANESICRLLGVQRQSLTGKPFTTFLPKDSGQTLLQATSEVCRTRTTKQFEQAMVNSHGKDRMFQWTAAPGFDRRGRLTEVFAIGQDVTEKVLIQKKLSQTINDQEILLNSMPIQVFFVDDSRRYGLVNRAHADYFRTTPDKMSGELMIRFLSPKDAESIELVLNRVKLSRKQEYFECFLTAQDQSIRMFGITANPLLENDGSITHIICSAIDITHQRVYELQLIYQLEFEHLINEISSSFVINDATLLLDAVQSSIVKMGQFAGADRSFYFLYESDTVESLSECSWSRSGETIYRGFWTEKSRSKLFRRLSALEELYLPSVSSGESLSKLDREYFKQHDIHSALYIPLERSGIHVGFVGFETVGKQIEWADELRMLFKLYADLLLHASQRIVHMHRMEKERNLGIQLSTAANLQTVLDLCLAYAIEISGMDSGGIYLADDSRRMLKLVKYTGLTESFIDKASFYSYDSVQYATLKKGKPVYAIINELPEKMVKILEDEGLTFLAVIPVFYHSKIIACLNVASHSIVSISERTITELESLVGRLGPSISKATVEDEIKRNWRSMDNLFNSINDFLVIFDTEGNVLNANTAVLEQLGLAEKIQKSTNIAELYAFENKNLILKQFKQIAEGESDSIVHSIRSSDGDLLPVETRVVRGEWKRESAWFALSHDLRRVKREEEFKLQLQKQTQQARRVESLGRMAGAIAHRFNNLLMGVIGNLELAKMLIKRQRDPLPKIKYAEETAHKATELGKLMLTYVGQGRSDQQPCDISEIVESLIPLIKSSAGNGIMITTDLTRGLPRVFIDRQALIQCIINVTTNSWEAIGDETGHIRIETGLMEPVEISNLSLVDQETLSIATSVSITIADDGPGIGEDDLEKIFDPFFSTKFTGRGLGLSIVQGIVRSHDGIIAVDSSPGKGTMVVLIFQPMENPDTITDDKKQTDVNWSGNGFILLADDEAMIRTVAETMLEELGFNVITVGSGEQALATFKKRRSDILLTICDVSLPDKDGWEVLRAIRREDASARLILSTSHSPDPENLKQEEQPDAIIQKPFKFKSLIQTIKDLTGQ